jgi:hypothetical protein
MVKNSNPTEFAKIKSHFANLCQLAMADAILNKKETEYLNDLCKQYGLTKNDFDEIMDNAYSIEFVSPETPLARLEQMYDLVRMVLMDEIIDERKVQLCVKVAKSLGFGPQIVGDLIKALVTVEDTGGEDDFGLEDLKIILKSN